MAQKVEPATAVHLSHDALGLGVHTLGRTVVKGQDDGIVVLGKAADEGVQVRQMGGVSCGDPRIETVSIAFAWPEQVGETADESRQVDHLRAGDGEAVQQAPVLFAEGAGPGEQQPGKSARGDGKAVDFDAAALGECSGRPWVNVAVERCLPVLQGRSGLGRSRRFGR